MKLKNDFFKIISTEDNDEGTSYLVRINSDHFIYKAHFPDMPVTPGVCIIQMALEILEEHCGAKLYIKFLKNVKFMSVISPEHDGIISFVIHKLEFGTDERECKAVIYVKHEADIKAKISMICSKNEGKDE